MPQDAWSNGQWEGHPNLFHPKPKEPTRYEDLYWEEHPEEPGLPIGDPIIPMLIFVALGFVANIIFKKNGLVKKPL